MAAKRSASRPRRDAAAIAQERHQKLDGRYEAIGASLFASRSLIQIAGRVDQWPTAFTISDISFLGAGEPTIARTALGRLHGLGMVDELPVPARKRRLYCKLESPWWPFMRQTWQLIEDSVAGTAPAYCHPDPPLEFPLCDYRRPRPPAELIDYLALYRVAMRYGRYLCGTETRFLLLVWLGVTDRQKFTFWDFLDEAWGSHGMGHTYLPGLVQAGLIKGRTNYYDPNSTPYRVVPSPLHRIGSDLLQLAAELTHQPDDESTAAP